MSKSAKAARDGFRNRRGFILACIGSAVGMGNIWRFPYLVSARGGMTFLLPYFLFVLLIGSTGLAGEMALGRAARTGPIGAFGMCAEKRGRRRLGEAAGVLPVLGSLALAIGYSVVVGWIIKYMVMAFTGELFAMGQDTETISGAFGSTAAARGADIWIAAALVIACLIMVPGISGGIETCNKLLMPMLFCLFIGLGIYIAFLPGSRAGYRYIFTIDPAGLADPELWIYAFGQAFFSLSVAGNGIVIYGSYLPEDEDIPRSARSVAAFDTLAALLAALVIIPAMAAGSAGLSEGGPGLMFVYLVSVINGMPGGRIIGVIFFVCVFFAGITSLINLYEAPVEAMQTYLKLGRGPAVALVIAFGGTAALCIQAITTGWMDALSIYICPLGALLAGIMFFWAADRDFVLEQVNRGASAPLGSLYFTLSRYVYCACALMALAAGAALGGIG